MEIKEFKSAIAEIADVEGSFEHPYLTRIKFIFATEEGARLLTSQAGLKQGIKAEDFDEVIRTSIHMPIKMRYLGKFGAQNHSGAITIGHITNMEKIELEGGVKALAAEGVLYTSEFPEEVEYLKDAHASGKAPGISYEVIYDGNKSIIEDGVEWLKGLITQAATIVKSPAYGSRTAIMALASNKELSQEEFNEEVLSIITPKESITEGGSDMDEKDKEEIQRLTALAGDKDKILADKDAELTTLSGDLDTVKAALEAAQKENAELKRTMLVESRAKAYAEAGFSFDEDAEKANAKKELLAKMEEEVFTAYIADLKTAKETKKAALASAASDRGIPRLTAMERNGSLDDLKEGLRGISRKN